MNNFIIGPYFFDGHLNADSYLEFLNNSLPQLLENVPENTRRTMWYQHDGVPCHFARNVRNYLNEQYRDRWIGRGGPAPWPARSPDLTVMDFFLWGFVKDYVFQEEATIQEAMKAE